MIFLVVPFFGAVDAISIACFKAPFFAETALCPPGIVDAPVLKLSQVVLSRCYIPRIQIVFSLLHVCHGKLMQLLACEGIRTRIGTSDTVLSKPTWGYAGAATAAVGTALRSRWVRAHPPACPKAAVTTTCTKVIQDIPSKLPLFEGKIRFGSPHEICRS